MSFKTLSKKLLEKDGKDSKKSLNLFVIGINHYDISHQEGQVLKSNIPQNTTYLTFPNVTREDYEYLHLTQVQKEDRCYKFISQFELGEKHVTCIYRGLDSFMIMRPQYAIIEDGRLFCADNVPSLPEGYFKEAVRRLREINL